MRISFAPALALVASFGVPFASGILLGIPSPVALVAALIVAAMVGYGIGWMRAALTLGGVAVALALAGLFLVMSGAVPAFAQDVSSIAAISSVDQGVVTVTVADHVNPLLEFIGGLLGSAVACASIVALVVRFLPAWVQPFATPTVQAMLAHYLEQAVLWAIQEVEGFDKGKTIDVNVGSAAAAAALKFLLDQAPDFVVKLAGGKDAIAKAIVAFFGRFDIVLGSGVQPEQVAAAAAESV